jgi:serine/threonine protein kinase
MALKFTVESFLNLVRQSRLVDSDRLQQLVSEMPAGGDSQSVADALVASGALTAWQSDKLLKGKHKGFFLGKYRLQSLLGKGGMSSVYLADHVLMRRRCAIKVLPHKKVNDSSYLERFHREAQAVASLDHPNIVRAYDVDREDDGGAEIHFLVMEYVEGESLQELVVDRGPREFREVADFIRQSAYGLTHAHEAGLVHRDIKPGNLLVDTEGVVKILDLGLARFFEENDEDPITLRHDERVLGTADYLAPEQALDSHQVDARADIYSLGCTMYFLLTARPPFDEGTLAQRLMWHQTREPAAISESRSDIPGPLADVLSKMMAKVPSDRFQTADEVAEQLTAWLGDGETTQTQPPVAKAVPVAQPVEQAPKPTRETTPSAPVAPQIAAPVEPPTPAVDEVIAGERGDTERITGAESEPDMASVDDPGLADFLSTLGEDSSEPTSPVVEPGPVQEPEPEQELPSPAEPDPPPVAAAIESPTPAVPVAPPVAEPPVVAEAPAAPAVPIDVSPPERAPEIAPLPEAQDGGFPMLDTSAPAIESQPNTRSRTNSTTTSRRGSRSGAPDGSGRGLKIGLAVGGIAVIIVVMTMGSGDGENGSSPGTGGGATSKGDGGGGTTGGSEPVAKTPVTSVTKAKRTLEVGPEAEFKTIAAALAYVRDHKAGYRTSSRRIQATINVLGGNTYAESIEIDDTQQQWPKGIEIISTGVEPAVIAAPGQKPGIQLKQVEYIRIVGFRIDSKGKPSGVVLIGVQDRVQLEDLTIDGFTAVGIDARGVAGDPSQDVLNLAGLVLRSGGPDAVGLKFSSGTYDTNSHVRIVGCRVIGPLRAGLQVTDHVVDLVLQESIIQSAKVAMLFSGQNRRLQTVSIRNNTFAQVERGLVFEHMPTESSDNVSIRRNLFFEVGGPECVVENKYDELKFSQMVGAAAAVTENWSTRTEQADLKRGERELMLPGGANQRGVQVEFSSTDPQVADFLEPRAGTLPRRGPGDPKDPAFIGAVPFRQR